MFAGVRAVRERRVCGVCLCACPCACVWALLEDPPGLKRCLVLERHPLWAVWNVQQAPTVGMSRLILTVLHRDSDTGLL